MTENYSHLEDLTANKFLNLNYIRRYSNTRLIQEETDSQHTMTMQLLAMYFYDRYPKLPIKNIIYRIFVHDLDEALSGEECGQQIHSFGDVPKFLKYFNEETYELIRHATEETMYNNLENKNIFKDVTKAKYDFSTKQFSAESAFVNILDSLEVLIKLRDEVYLQGANSVICSHFKDALKGYKSKIHSKWVEPYLSNGFWKDIYDECVQYYEDFKEEYYKLKR